MILDTYMLLTLTGETRTFNGFVPYDACYSCYSIIDSQKNPVIVVYQICKSILKVNKDITGELHKLNAVQNQTEAKIKNSNLRCEAVIYEGHWGAFIALSSFRRVLTKSKITQL